MAELRLHWTHSHESGHWTAYGDSVGTAGMWRWSLRFAHVTLLLPCFHCLRKVSFSVLLSNLQAQVTWSISQQSSWKPVASVHPFSPLREPSFHLASRQSRPFSSMLSLLLWTSLVWTRRIALVGLCHTGHTGQWRLFAGWKNGFHSHCTEKQAYCDLPRE